jgi:hypothetical protein
MYIYEYKVVGKNEASTLYPDGLNSFIDEKGRQCIFSHRYCPVVSLSLRICELEYLSFMEQTWDFL